MEKLSQGSSYPLKKSQVEGRHHHPKPPSRTNTFEDFGTSFTFKTSGPGRDVKKGTSFHVKEEKGKRRVMETAIEVQDSFSEDEIDFLSSQATDEETPQLTPATRPTNNTVSLTTDTRLSGSHAKPSTSDLLRTMKFKKMKNVTTGMASTQVESSQAAMTVATNVKLREPTAISGFKRRTPVLSDVQPIGSREIVHLDDNHCLERSRDVLRSSDIPNTQTTKNAPCSRSQTGEKNTKQRSDLDGAPHNTKPKPRALSKARTLLLDNFNGTSIQPYQPSFVTGTNSTFISTHPSSGTPKPPDYADAHTRQGSTKLGSDNRGLSNRSRLKKHDSATNGITVEKPKLPSIKKPRFSDPPIDSQSSLTPSPTPPSPKEFPVSPLSSPKHNNVIKVLSKSPSMPNFKRRARPPKRDAYSSTLEVQAFPLSLDAEKGSRSRSVSPKPLKKPSGSKSYMKLHSRQLSTAAESSTEETKRRKNKKAKKEKKKVSSELQPFPLSTQVLASIEPKSPGSSTRHKLKKHMSENNGASIKRKKKRKEDPFVVSTSDDNDINSGDSLAWDEDITICPSADPKTLCPFCDKPLPLSPSPRLRSLLTRAIDKSRPDPRPGNPLGRTAKNLVYVDLCQRHRFENELVPEAEIKGWPRSIDWERLQERVGDLESYLQNLLKRMGAGTGISTFWDELKAEVEQKGTRAVASVQNQFATFEKTQPGYYGELGYAIIHQTLFDLFPTTSLDFIAPFTLQEFFQRVLVPEVAVKLIMQDKQLQGAEGKREALNVLRESARYGAAMFSDENGRVGVVDKIVMERAMKRREELIEEEREERERNERERRSDKRKGKAKAGIEASEVAQLKPCPNPKFRSTSHGCPLLSDQQLVETDCESMEYSPTLQPTRSSQKYSAHGKGKNANSDFEDDARGIGSHKRTSQGSERDANHRIGNGSASWLLSDSSSTSIRAGRCDNHRSEDSDEDMASSSDSSEPRFSTSISNRRQRKLFSNKEDLPDSEDEMEVVETPIGRRRPKRRSSCKSGIEDPPKPIKSARTELSTSLVDSTKPLAQARRRKQRQVDMHMTGGVSDTGGHDDPWIKSMIISSPSTSPGTSMIFGDMSKSLDRIQWDLHYSWLLNGSWNVLY